MCRDFSIEVHKAMGKRIFYGKRPIKACGYGKYNIAHRTVKSLYGVGLHNQVRIENVRIDVAAARSDFEELRLHGCGRLRADAPFRLGGHGHGGFVLCPPERGGDCQE